MKTVLIAAAALAIGAVPVLAQVAPPAPMAKGARMAEPVKRSDMEARLRERLGKLDTNRDGLIAREEMRAAAQSRMAEARTKAFDRLDANRDGMISRDEFAAPRAGAGPRPSMRRMLAMRGAGRIGAAGALADKDGRIAIDAAVKAALARFDEADANRDGTLTPEERKAAREARRAARG